jgi:dTDP-4-dehydrorhamnose reductase
MARRVLVTGATGQLGAYLVRELIEQGYDVVAWGHSRPTMVAGVAARPVDLADAVGVAQALGDAHPEIVIHAAAMAAVADCARDPAAADAVNARGTAALAQLCDAAGTRLVHISTDLVFDGAAAPYAESAEPKPLSVYGRGKAAGERAVLASGRHAAVRVSLLFGPSRNERPSYFDGQVAALRAGRPVRLFHDEWRTPLGLMAAARALVAVARSDVTGSLHVGGPERMSRLEMGLRLAAYLGVKSTGIEACSRLSVAGEPRPCDTSLDSSGWRALFPQLPQRAFEQALAEMGVGS